MQLRQTKTLGALNEHDGGVGHVDTHFNDGGRDEDIQPAEPFLQDLKHPVHSGGIRQFRLEKISRAASLFDQPQGLGSSLQIGTIVNRYASAAARQLDGGLTPDPFCRTRD